MGTGNACPFHLETLTLALVNLVEFTAILDIGPGLAAFCLAIIRKQVILFKASSDLFLAVLPNFYKQRIFEYLLPDLFLFSALADEFFLEPCHFIDKLWQRQSPA